MHSMKWQDGHIMKIFTPEQLEHWSKLGPLQIQYHPHAEIL
jgi:hypothetical protein